MQLHNQILGYSLYLSTFADQWPTLVGRAGTGVPVFLSLHISEEFDESYCQRARSICALLHKKGFRVIADVSVKTLTQFGCGDLCDLAQELGLWAVRIDYGFSPQEIGEIGKRMPVILNASTITPEDAKLLAASCKEVYAMHNFYPRPETGLDEAFLRQTTQMLQSAGLKVMAFIPGDENFRGPVFEGLPTLEAHRKVRPSAAFVDLCQRFAMDVVFVGDPGLSEKEARRIGLYCEEHVIPIPAVLEPEWEHLYDVDFTCRADSPQWMIRFRESREYSCKGVTVKPEHCTERRRGSITVDNEKYGRYTGEIQLLRQDHPQDDRVNVIGTVRQEDMLLCDLVRRGQKFRLVRP